MASTFQIFDQEQIASLKRAGEILRGCLQHTARYVKAGVSTKELDVIAESYIRGFPGATPAFKGYHGYPATLCTSVNDACVHGIPGELVLSEGDIVSLDCGVIVDGLYTDACITVPVGKIPAATQKFLDDSAAALEEACAMIKPGIHIGDISSTIQTFVESHGYKCIRALTGHGLGNSLHQFPDIPNVGEPGSGPQVPAWTVIAIEPITAIGTDRIREGDDGWTICTQDGSLSAHFEHTVLVTDTGCEILA
jgi:methionyl aminopeptidase